MECKKEVAHCHLVGCFSILALILVTFSIVVRSKLKSVFNCLSRAAGEILSLAALGDALFFAAAFPFGVEAEEVVITVSALNLISRS